MANKVQIAYYNACFMLHCLCVVANELGMAPSTGKVYQFTLSPSKWGHSGVRPYEPKDDASANEADDGDEVRELGKDNQGSTKENEDAGRSKQTPALATREPRTRGDHSVTGYCLHVQKRFLIDQPKLAGKVRHVQCMARMWLTGS
jgi:hypothetical protein